MRMSPQRRRVLPGIFDKSKKGKHAAANKTKRLAAGTREAPSASKRRLRPSRRSAEAENDSAESEKAHKSSMEHFDKVNEKKIHEGEEDRDQTYKREDNADPALWRPNNCQRLGSAAYAAMLFGNFEHGSSANDKDLEEQKKNLTESNTQRVDEGNADSSFDWLSQVHLPAFSASSSMSANQPIPVKLASSKPLRRLSSFYDQMDLPEPLLYESSASCSHKNECSTSLPSFASQSHLSRAEQFRVNLLKADSEGSGESYVESGEDTDEVDGDDDGVEQDNDCAGKARDDQETTDDEEDHELEFSGSVSMEAIFAKPLRKSVLPSLVATLPSVPQSKIDQVSWKQPLDSRRPSAASLRSKLRRNRAASLL